jgi:hypothetical protein
MELLQPDKGYSWNSQVHATGFYTVPYTFSQPFHTTPQIHCNIISMQKAVFRSIKHNQLIKIAAY